MAKNEDGFDKLTNHERWLTFFSELQAYIESHGHLPDKHVVENRGLLSKAKYLRKKIKERTLEDWKREMFEEIAEMRDLTIHTGGRKKDPLGPPV